MANRLDIVAVRIEDEGGVVVRVIMRTQAGGAVVLAAGSQRGPVKGIDADAVLGR